ncbi:MBL fold metallo-hydrolase [Chryseobacterium populi]|uniref:Putative Zn-dependent hydrolase of beta-lactamase n=1 Tax=Chryseobacterium populi TaxID=1144316 RepID=J2KS37_9FLAO|nr:MBL fold metallo-hydrolase [Chryseobacterium populi]EJL75868.1 putative Zn-dependent hydrolase of beta-lactamase [Chryseobacterium populi]
MKLQLWRNATLLLDIDGIRILIDPMLGENQFPMTGNELLNPLVDLPFDRNELIEKLEKTDAVAVTHLHPDHWDQAAIDLLDKNLPIICPSAISAQISEYGFKNIIPINESIIWKNIHISLTKGLHGTGEIGEKMGLVNGFVFKVSDQTVYIVGDSIWYPQVAEEITRHQPKHIIVAGGAATFSVGNPIIMTSKDIISLCEYAPEASIWITHLEAVSHCKEDRNFILARIAENGLEKRCFILNDGEETVLNF